jgi:hypothetical protein
MTSAARRWAVGAFGAVTALTVVPATVVTTAGPARAANGEWEVTRWSVDPGDDVAGDKWTITGTISAPFPTDTITDVDLTLTRVDADPNCPNLTATEHIRDGDGLSDETGTDADSTTTTTAATSTTGPSTTTTSTTAPAGDVDRARFRFDVIPRCNGRYQLAVVGHSDRPGTLPNDTSDPLPMGDPTDPDNAVTVNLRPPDVTGVQLAANPNRSVAVVWEYPAGYSTPPADFVGYGIDYSYDNGTTWNNGALTNDPTAHSATFTPKSTEPAGNYQVRIRGVRKNANGTLDPALVASGGATAIGTVAVGAPPPPTTARSSGSGGHGSNGHVAPSGTAPSTTFDEGFDETLDYSDLEEGDAEADVPEDASSFLDFGSDSGTGQAILTPFAIALCLAVWAFHLRILARRLETPHMVSPTITVNTTRPGRTS